MATPIPQVQLIECWSVTKRYIYIPHCLCDINDNYSQIWCCCFHRGTDSDRQQYCNKHCIIIHELVHWICLHTHTYTHLWQTKDGQTATYGHTHTHSHTHTHTHTHTITLKKKSRLHALKQEPHFFFSRPFSFSPSPHFGHLGSQGSSWLKHCLGTLRAPPSHTLEVDTASCRGWREDTC